MNPTDLHQWAIRHGVSMTALHELGAMMGTRDDQPTAMGVIPENSEAAIQNTLRINASKIGARLWRNNNGAGYMENGQFVRWGLCNESAAMNERIKSSDLIGIKPVMIQQHMVGHIIGQFYAREVKAAGWQYTGTKHEAAQLAFLELVASLGGDARFANRGDQV
jgi:hypothetical protein